MALLLTAFDVRMIARGGVAGAARLTRHLLRMCLAMFMATASLFLGQPKVFPMAVRHSGLLPVPVVLVVLALLYSLIRVRVWPRAAACSCHSRSSRRGANEHAGGGMSEARRSSQTWVWFGAMFLVLDEQV